MARRGKQRKVADALEGIMAETMARRGKQRSDADALEGIHKSMSEAVARHG